MPACIWDVQHENLSLSLSQQINLSLSLSLSLSTPSNMQAVARFPYNGLKRSTKSKLPCSRIRKGKRSPNTSIAKTWRNTAILMSSVSRQFLQPIFSLVFSLSRGNDGNQGISDRARWARFSRRSPAVSFSLLTIPDLSDGTRE